MHAHPIDTCVVNVGSKLDCIGLGICGFGRGLGGPSLHHCLDEQCTVRVDRVNNAMIDRCVSALKMS